MSFQLGGSAISGSRFNPSRRNVMHGNDDDDVGRISLNPSVSYVLG